MSASGVSDGAGIGDEVTVAVAPTQDPPELPAADSGVQGPDNTVWGDHFDRLAADIEGGKFAPPVDGETVQGPDLEVWGA